MTTERYDNSEYTASQYGDSSNLVTRVQFHDRFSTNRYGWMPWVFDQLHLQPNSKILELGCGGGGIWKRNLERIPENCSILLTDFTDGMLQDAQKNLVGSKIFEFKKVDANEKPLPFPDATFDIVIANHMLNYIQDRQDLFSEITRVLKPNGQIFASAIGRRSNIEIRELISVFDSTSGTIWGNVSAPFNLENGAGQLAECFKDVSLRRYEDAFEVTEAGPLVDYIFSGGVIDWGEDRKDEFKELIKQKMEEQGGVLHITKDAGIFKAVRG